jgi:hypothetical protein
VYNLKGALVPVIASNTDHFSASRPSQFVA